jgi:hypothetical protein
MERREERSKIINSSFAFSSISRYLSYHSSIQVELERMDRSVTIMQRILSLVSRQLFLVNPLTLQLHELLF